MSQFNMPPGVTTNDIPGCGTDSHDSHDELREAAKTMRKCGHSYTAILEAMVARNEVCCDPKLSCVEVAQIVHQVCLDDVKACG